MHSALDGNGHPTEAPYGCCLPTLTRFVVCRRPNPSNALSKASIANIVNLRKTALQGIACK